METDLDPQFQSHGGLLSSATFLRTFGPLTDRLLLWDPSEEPWPGVRRSPWCLEFRCSSFLGWIFGFGM